MDLSASGQNGATPQVAIDQAGDAIAAWVRFNGPLSSGGPKDFFAQAAVRPAGGSFAAPVDLGAFDSAAVSGPIPQVAMDRVGDGVVVWQAPGGRVQVAFRPAGGGFSAPVDLGSGSNPRVAMDQTGDAVVAWQTPGGSVQAAVRPAGGGFAAPADLGAGFQPQVAMDAAGDAVLVWERMSCNPSFDPNCFKSSSSLQAALRPAGGSFSAPANISGNTDASGPHVAMDRAGDAIAAWGQRLGTVQVAARRAAGGFSAPVDLGIGNGPVVAMDGPGDALVAWDDKVAVRPPGGRFSAPVRIPGGEVSGFTGVAMDGAGDSVLTAASNGTVVKVIARSAQGSFSTPANLSAAGKAGEYPQVAMDPAGDAVVVWQRDDSIGATNFIVQASSARAVASINRLRASPAAFAAANHGGSIARRTSTTIAYTDTHASRTAFAVSKLTPGIKRRGRCVAPPRGQRIAPRARCTRQLALGSFSHSDRAGRNHFRFTGSLRGKKLPPGRYLLRATPRLPGIAGRTATASFRITG